ncbi:unnamed protein product [Coffea canephora]|uniref:Receptor-like serine/threonine-protein kinase n=1 Tax=Coffea canephora TaxID=49390 RepID=A0A068U7P3_COFCA|nr:unnamed protein product [Coffea canephora]
MFSVSFHLIKFLKLEDHDQVQTLFYSYQYHLLSLIDSTDTITINEPMRDPATIVSASQNFKLAFFSPVNTSDRYVGIILNIPAQSVVWVANRDDPITDSAGMLTISEDGNAVILNGQKNVLWSSNVANSVANSSAQLLDTGNLVLRDNSNGRILWESFQTPTDTLVRTMKIGVISKNSMIRLTSWRSPSDPSVGNFSFGVDPLRIPEFFIWNHSKPYWRSGPWNGNVFIGIPEMSSAYQNRFDLVTNPNGSEYFTHSFINDLALLYYVLNSSGVLVEKVSYYGDGHSKVSWTSLESECDVYGKCGPFGSCNPQHSPICTCLQGFEPKNKEEWDKGNWTGGCSRKALLQCDRNISAGQVGKPDGFLKLANIKIPDFAHLMELLRSATEQDCGNQCLNNCSCIAYAYSTGIGCMYWSSSLIDIQQFSFNGADLHIRVAHTELGFRKNMKAVIASTVVLGLLFLAISAYCFRKWLTRHRGNKQNVELSLFEEGEVPKKESILSDKPEQSKLEELPLYSYETLAIATDTFHVKNKLGTGGFGPVFKGKLLSGQKIAVKRLSNSSNQGIKEFMNEVELISKLQHRNLVRLLGCCVEREEKMLIYEYMPNKSLDAYLFDLQKRDLLYWNRRKLIIEGIGRGLLYLHRDSRLKIIHRDLKPSNILLDEELNPKISDFGLARIFGGNQDQANTNRVVGTYGYMAPEYAMKGKFSEKSDVYSFGVLLLEIVSGKKNTSSHADENDLSLIGYAWKLWNENEAVKLVDPALSDPRVEMEILRYVHVGLLCVQESANDRPNVSNVLSMLNSEIAELPPPKLPAYTARLGSTESEGSQQSGHSVNDVSLTIIQGR